jgi:hypothetical protein
MRALVSSSLDKPVPSLQGKAEWLCIVDKNPDPVSDNLRGSLKAPSASLNFHLGRPYSSAAIDDGRIQQVRDCRLDTKFEQEAL